MNYFYLITIILALSAQNVMKKAYTKKNSGGVYFFSVLSCLCAALFFVVTSGGLEWDRKVIPYALAFAMAYSISIVFGLMAIQYGSLSLTSLVMSYSLMIPTLYGLVFLNETISFGFWPGVILLVISMVLINQKVDKSPITWRWMICALFAFLGNGLCVVFQKMQQITFDGAYKNELMIMALLAVAVVLGIFSFSQERESIPKYAKKGWYFGALNGILNGITNLFVMLLSGRMAASLMFPLISAGGIIITYVISKLVYEEKLTKRQFVGFVLGVLSVIFLNI